MSGDYVKVLYIWQKCTAKIMQLVNEMYTMYTTVQYTYLKTFAF